MIFKLIIDKTAEETITATVHQRCPLTDTIEALVLEHTGTSQLTAYTEDDIKPLSITQIECITVLNGKTYAIDSHGDRYRLKRRLYELEASLPSCFIRINKSTLANENRLERFTASFSGAVDAVFKCGHTEYVSRRCFAAIKRRYDEQ